jgi:hypothetical protein
MEFQDPIVLISLTISTLVLLFIIWDHLKDDRILAKQVQEFYNDIEMLIFTDIQIKYYESLNLKEKSDDELIQLTKYKNRDIIQNSYLEVKIRQNFSKYSDYLGLTLDKENKNYLNNTIYFLNEGGILSKRNFETSGVEDIIESYLEIKEEEILEIEKFLNSLRFYWRKNYKKFIFRPNLKSSANFHELLAFSHPLEKPRKSWRNKFSKY